MAGVIFKLIALGLIAGCFALWDWWGIIGFFVVCIILHIIFRIKDGEWMKPID